MIDHAPQDFGALFRHAREASGVSLRDIADTTKLPVTTLKALEANRIGQLPGGIFRRAIIRTVAAEVGLDPERTVRAFVAQYPDEVPSSTDVVSEPPRTTPRLLQAALSLLGALIPLLAGAVYFSASLADRPHHVADVMPGRFEGSLDADVDRTSAGDVDSLAMLISVSERTRLAVIADGREVVARELAAGEVIRVSVSDDVVLMGDNAGAVNFSINGFPGRTLGDHGSPLSARIARGEYLSWLIRP